MSIVELATPRTIVVRQRTMIVVRQRTIVVRRHDRVKSASTQLVLALMDGDFN